MVIYDAIVIGCGPSGLALAAALNGLTPYYGEKPLFDQQIQKLADQIIPQIPEESRRSENPVTLMVNHLVDQGQVTFNRRDSDVNFLVLTDGQIGGCWNEMDQEMHCLSPADWMALPGLAFPAIKGNFPSMGEVSAYYKSYAEKMDLKKNVREETKVTTAQRIEGIWKIQATYQGEAVGYQARNILLATGNYSVPKRLGIEGEELDFVTHRIPKKVTPAAKVLVVGTGMTAADCVLKALKCGCEVHHVFRTEGTKLGVKRFENSDDKYPHYARLWRLMCEKEQDDSYHPHQNGEIKKIYEGGCLIGGEEIIIDQVMVLIGSKSDLSFLQESFRDIKELFDKYTYQVADGLFSVGQPTGDNFVKLNTHGCFAAAHSVKQLCS